MNANERLVARDMQSWQTSSEMKYDPPIPTELNVTVGGSAGVGAVAFTSSTKGTGKDNAVNPDALTNQQKARAVTLNYQYKSCIVITFSVPAMDAEPQSTKYDGTKYDYGRNFLFSGGGGVTYECTRTPSCKDDSPAFCEDELKTDRDKLEHCKEQEFKNVCKESCGYCPVDIVPTLPLHSDLQGTPGAKHVDSAVALVGGGVAAMGLLVLLFFASKCVSSSR